jgi:putative transposase
LERVNREIGRRSDVVGICPTDASAIHLARALLIERNEWLVCRRYLSAGSVLLIDASEEEDKETETDREEAIELNAA